MANREYAKHVEAFCRDTRILSKGLLTSFPRDAEVKRIHQQISVAISHAPAEMMDLVGPHLAKYGKEIYEEDADFFLNHDFSEELAAAGKEADDVALLMPKIRDKYRTLNEVERTEYIELVVRLLDSYTAAQTAARTAS